MLTPKNNLLATKFWDLYIHRIIEQDFANFRIPEGFQLEAHRSALVLCNHFSWWDGFFVYELNRKLLGKQFHVMMLEEQLRKHSMLRWAGAFSIDKSSGRGMMASLQFATKLLESPQNMVLMFPQGQIESMHKAVPTFQSGVLRILKQATTAPQIIFCANLPDYYSSRKPTLNVFLEKYDGSISGNALEQAFQQFYAVSKSKISEIIS